MTIVCNREAERCVLGAMLRDNDTIDDAVHLVRAEDFYVDAHQKTFAAIVALYDRGQAVDLPLLADELQLRGHVEDVGGYAFLGELTDAAATGAAIVAHAELVRDAAIRRRLAHAHRAGLQEAERPTMRAPEALAQAEQQILEIAQMGIVGQAVRFDLAVSEAFDRIDARSHGDAARAGLNTGFPDLDRLLCGMQNGELIILAARPSVGKTSLAMAIAENVAGQSFGVFVASLEQNRAEQAERRISAGAGVDGKFLRSGRVSADQYRELNLAGDALRRLPLWIDDSAGQDMLRIAANVRRLKRREGLRLAVVDYLGLIEPEDRRENREQQVSGISRRLKRLAREVQIPVLALAQLNRDVEKRADHPRLSDLRDSGSLEQDADTVLLLHRLAIDDGLNNMGEVQSIEVIVAKQRNGPTGETRLGFNRRYTRFENYAGP